MPEGITPSCAARDEGIRGGRTYDAVIATCALVVAVTPNGSHDA
jgi:hypothetical protein